MSHVLGFLLLCFTVLGDKSKDDPLERVYASIGHSTILPCQGTIPKNSEVPTIEWSKDGLEPSSYIFVYRNFEIYEEKHKDFQFRTHLFMTELHHGNFSMRLSEVRETDAGKYLCKILWNEDHHEFTTVELLIEGPVDSCTFPMLYTGLGSGLFVLFLAVVGFVIYQRCNKSDEKNKFSRQSSDETTASSGSETKRFLVPKECSINIEEDIITCHMAEPPDLICSTPSSTISKADSRHGSMFVFPDVADNAATYPVTCEMHTVHKSVKSVNWEENKRQDTHTDDEMKSTYSPSKPPSKKNLIRSKSLSDPCPMTLEDLRRRHSLSGLRSDTEKLLQRVPEELETDGPSPPLRDKIYG